ncbi:MAG: hypothetical protein II535_04855, partial [Bacteroidales bacterium]|nr:hypothetical protein [Bacteroidales bacterium]
EAAAAVPYGANFQVFLDHGTETDYSTESFSYSDCRTGTVTRSWYFDLLPGEVMSLRVRLQDSDTGTEYAGAWQQVTGPTPPSEWTLKFYNIRISHASLHYRDLRSNKSLNLPDVGLQVPGFVLGGKEQTQG